MPKNTDRPDPHTPAVSAEPKPKLSRLEQIESKRAARRAAHEAARAEQKAIDLEAIFELETEHGEDNVAVLETHFTPGLPVCVAVRAPRPAEIKRYKHRVTPRKTRSGDEAPTDPAGAAVEVAEVCRIYPDAETYVKLLEARPGLSTIAGMAALELASGKVESEGKS